MNMRHLYMPEDIIRYIMSFMWKCNACDNYMEMRNNWTYDHRCICADCQEIIMLRTRLQYLGFKI